MNRSPKVIGAALVLAMLLAALASSIVAGLLWHQQLWLRQATLSVTSRRRSRWPARLDWARLILQEDAQQRHRPLWRAMGDQAPTEPARQREIGGEIPDQQGLFNVNVLVRGRRAAAGHGRALWAAAGAARPPAALGPALADWLDANGEAAQARRRGPPYVALRCRAWRNRPLVA
jgi:type II secretory pathway component PulK